MMEIKNILKNVNAENLYSDFLGNGQIIILKIFMGIAEFLYTFLEN